MYVCPETERLKLRRFTPADADHLFTLDSDPEVMRYLNGGTPTPRAVIEDQVLPRIIRDRPEPSGAGFWAAVEKSTGEFIGWFSLRPLPGSSPPDAELGYRIRRASWGRGYATEGATALIRVAFSTAGLERVHATTYEDNLASRRVMEKLGMILVRRFRMTPAELNKSGTYLATLGEMFGGEDVEYALQRSDWLRRQPA